MTRNLAGKWALVTGAASGIGRELCLALAREGCNLVLADLNLAGMESLAAELELLGAGTFCRQTDVTDAVQIQSLVDIVRDKTGGVDILINGVGIALSANLMDTSPEQWDYIMRINFYSAVDTTRAFLPDLMKKSGHVVNISTGQAFFPVPTWGAYAASKAALASYSECLTWEMKRYHVMVTTVFPGVVNTPFYSEVAPGTPGQRILIWGIRAFGAKPEKVASLIVRGIKKNKKRVIHSLINWAPYLGRRPLPHIFELTGEIMARVFCEKSESEPLSDLTPGSGG